MIRKAILVLLTTIALVTGIAGLSAGSGYTSWHYDWGTWMDEESPSHQDWNIFIGCGAGGVLMINHVTWIDQQLTEQKQKWTGLGWTYVKSVSHNEHIDLSFKIHILVFSFIYPLIVSLLCAIYPTMVFYRGPLRRWRRRRKGLCLKCGYNLKGNTTGICSECGTEIKA